MAAPSSLSFNEAEAEGEKGKSVGETILSLPKCKGWMTHYFHLYQGFWYNNHAIEGTIFTQQNFNAKSTDILLASSPKCGTTWLKALAFAIKNRSQNEEHSSQSLNHLLLHNPHALVLHLEFGLFHSNSLEEVETLPSPRLIATHIPYSSLPESVSSSGCKVVYVCRDPKDMLVSMWHFYERDSNKEVPLISLEEAFDLFCQGVSSYGPYWDHVLGYYRASLEWPEKVLFLKYEGMQSDTLNQVKRLAEFLGYPFSLEEETKGVVEEIIQLCSFKNLSNLEVTKKGKLFGVLNNDIFYRKGKVGDSQNYLTDEMVECLNKITKDKFDGHEIGY